MWQVGEDAVDTVYHRGRGQWSCDPIFILQTAAGGGLRGGGQQLIPGGADGDGVELRVLLQRNQPASRKKPVINVL